MAYTIRLTPPALRQKALDIEKNAAIVQEEILAIEHIVSRLRPTFLGKTASAFFKDFDYSIEDAKQWDDIVRSFATEIGTAANNLEKADRSY